MKLIYTFIISSLFINILAAQEIVVISRLNNTSITEQNNIVVVSVLGESPAGVTEQNGIVVTTEPFPFILMGQATSIHDLPLIEGIQVYPNPVSITAVIERKQSDENYLVSLYSAGGTALFEQTWNKGENTMELSLQNLIPGIYIITVKDKEETKASQFKILKQ